jgi:hypothetical protein
MAEIVVTVTVRGGNVAADVVRVVNAALATSGVTVVHIERKDS